jgi:hypothetical protein
LGLSLYLAAPPAAAAVVGIATEDPATQADLVIVGRVERTRCEWTAARDLIVTRALVRVEEVVRGAHARRRVIVETDGGEIGEVGFHVTDSAKLRDGQRVVLFLTESRAAGERQVRRVHAEAQGAYEVGEDGIARKGGFHAVAHRDRVDYEVPLADLLARVRSVR